MVAVVTSNCRARSLTVQRDRSLTSEAILRLRVRALSASRAIVHLPRHAVQPEGAAGTSGHRTFSSRVGVI